MSTNPIFKWENVHIIMRRKQPIFSIQYGLVNIIWTFPHNLDLSREWESVHRILTYPQNVDLITGCLIVLRVKAFSLRIYFSTLNMDFSTIYALYCPKMSTFLDINVRKLGLQVCGFSNVWNHLVHIKSFNQTSVRSNLCH